MSSRQLQTNRWCFDAAPRERRDPDRHHEGHGVATALGLRGFMAGVEVKKLGSRWPPDQSQW